MNVERQIYKRIKKRFTGFSFLFFFFNDCVEDLTEVVGNRMWHLILACVMCHRASMISTIVTIRQLTLNMCHEADLSTRSVSS